MNILDEYLNFLQEKQRGRALYRKIRSGELSPEDLERVKKAGLIKPKDQYIKGIEKGIKKSLKGKRIKWDEIDHKQRMYDKDTIADLKAMSKDELKQITAGSISHSDIEKMEKYTTKSGRVSVGPASDPDKKLISIPKRMNKGLRDYAFGSKKGYETVKPIIKKHEADEMLTAFKLKKKYNIKGKLDPSPLPNLNVAGGGHFGPEVLKKEKKLVDFYHNAYEKLNHWKNVRHPEYEDLKKYGSARAIRKTRERAIRNGIRGALDGVENTVKATGFSKSIVMNSIKKDIGIQMKLLPKTKRNLKFIFNILKKIK